MKKLFLISLFLLQLSVVFGQNQVENSSSKKIIGTWYADANRNTKWVFTTDGKLYNYDKDIFKVQFRYTISNSCQNNSSDNSEFLTLRDKDGNEFCFKINAINENKNGVLSMINMSSMQPVLFVNAVDTKVTK